MAYTTKMKYARSGIVAMFFILSTTPAYAAATTTTNTPSTTPSAAAQHPVHHFKRTHAPAATTPELPKYAALTFDDGPYGTSTEAVLQILQKEQVTATFFVIGQNVAEYPAITQEIARDGYEIGNHTYTHSNLATIPASVALREIASTSDIIASTTGQRPTLFRPPYGVLPKSLAKSITALGYVTELWNVDPKDWDYSYSPAKKILSRVEVQEHRKMVILLHDGRDIHKDYPRDNTVTALPSLIEDLKQEGYVFVTVSGMRAAK
jgi:peptidoglycan/xylan/chitin deacetylase (PgdA/CDA1 family)